MKKAISLIVCLLIVFSLFVGCGSDTQPTETTTPTTEPPAGPVLQVGYGRVDITPEYSVPLVGRHDEVYSE